MGRIRNCSSPPESHRREGRFDALALAFRHHGYEQLLQEGLAAGLEAELRALDNALLEDLAHTMRGELAGIDVPNRLPRRGEFPTRLAR